MCTPRQAQNATLSVAASRVSGVTMPAPSTDPPNRPATPLGTPPAATNSTAPLGNSSRARRRATNVAIIVGTIFSASLAAAYVTPRMDGAAPGGSGNALSVTAFLASIAASVGLCWRLRSTTALLVTAALACLPGLALPTDSLPALIAMASVIVWHPDVRAHVAVSAAATLATFVAVWRDSRGTRDGTSFWNSIEHPDGSSGSWPAMPWWQVALITALLVGLFAGVALVRRSRRDASRAAAVAHHERAHAQQAQAQARQSDVRAQHAVRQADEARARAQQTQAQVHDLGRQMAEKDEREALAREVHDVLGHRLSLLSMQANALEIEAQEAGSRDVEDRARQIQEGAAGSMTDLRSLLAMLRTGATDESADHHDLADIADLVRECIDAGTPVSSNVFVDQSHPLDPVISRSAYRITTELLTNARKHAPGSLVQLDIRGDARGGITISTANPLPDDARAARSDGSGTGLTGVARRTQDVGGSFWAGPSPDGRRFTASATLPWTMSRV